MKLIGQPMADLANILRDYKLNSIKIGCSEGECGACAVLLDGELVNSCLVPLAQVEGRNIQTLEGLNKDPCVNNIQHAFLEKGGAQCGACTPGMILAAKSLLAKNKKPTKDDVTKALAGNICRCTGYVKIVDSVIAACDSAG